MEDIDFDKDDFADIVAKDARYSPRAYALLMDVVSYLSGEGREGGGKDGEGAHMSAFDILEEFRDRTLDLYGPLAFTVLREWGVTRTEDVGEMMCNLVESRRVGRDENDSPDGFCGGYDFREAFLVPYDP